MKLGSVTVLTLSLAFVSSGALPSLKAQDASAPSEDFEDLWSDGTGTLLRVVNPPPFFRSSTEARTPQKGRDRDRRQRELTFDPRQTLVSLSDSPV